MGRKSAQVAGADSRMKPRTSELSAFRRALMPFLPMQQREGMRSGNSTGNQNCNYYMALINPKMPSSTVNAEVKAINIQAD